MEYYYRMSCLCTGNIVQAGVPRLDSEVEGTGSGLISSATVALLSLFSLRAADFTGFPVFFGVIFLLAVFMCKQWGVEEASES